MNNAILEYYQSIKNGSVVVNKWITLMYERVIHGIEEKEFRFDQRKANDVIQFCETYCRHHEGSLAPNRIKLELWQRAFLSVIFGIVDENGNRQFREVLLIIGRKNGKTLLAAAIAAYIAYRDNDYGKRIYMCAPKLQQASICFDGFYQMIKKEPLMDELAQRRRQDVYIAQSNTSVMPLAFNAKKSDGLNISLGICDEIAAWPVEPGLKQWEVLKSSQGARREPMLLAISTANYISDGIYDELYKRATRYLLGDSNEKRLAPFIYAIDDIAKWNDINELKKSNPNLGVSVSIDYMLEEVAVAEGSLSKKAEFLTKYCNIKQNSSVAWLPAEAVNQCFGTLPEIRELYGCAGVDLSRTTDLCSACCVVEKDGKLNVMSHFWLPGERIEEATARDGLPYRAYIQRGLLSASGDNFVDYHDVFNWFKHLIEDEHIYILKVGYDRYSAQYLIQDLNAYGFQTDDVFQGFNLTPVIQETDGLIRDGVFNFGDNDLLKIHLLNTALKMDAETGRCKTIKLNANAHIDGCDALLDAMTVRQKWSADIGEQLKNRG